MGLGVMYAFSGIDLIRHPDGWIWALRKLPESIQTLIDTTVGAETFLQIQGGVEILFAAIFLLWFMPTWSVKLVALITSVEMALILFFVGIDTITFRDIGVLAGTLALFQILRWK